MTGSIRVSASVRAGISLLEVLVVLTILGVVAGSVAPAFRQNVNENELESADRQVRHLAERARRTSVARGVPMTLTIDAAGAKYWVIATTSRADSVIATGSLTMPPGVRLESATPRAALRFAPTGEATSADAIVIRGHAAAISISSIGWRGSVIDHEK